MTPPTPGLSTYGHPLSRHDARPISLLSVDRASLGQHYAVHAEGTRRKWKMTLTPQAEPLAEKLRDIALYGRGIELRCSETRPTERAIQRTLLARAARTAHAINTDAGLVGRSRGEPQQQPAAAWAPTHGPRLRPPLPATAALRDG